MYRIERPEVQDLADDESEREFQLHVPWMWSQFFDSDTTCDFYDWNCPKDEPGKFEFYGLAGEKLKESN